jgi:hypothetical protein
VTDEEMYAIVNDDDVTVIEHSTEIHIEVDETGMEVERQEHSLKISHQKSGGKLQLEGLPPEEFFVDRNAKSIESAYVVAHRSEMRVGELVLMGYEFDEIEKLSALSNDGTFSDAEDFERRGYTQDGEEHIKDPSMRMVSVTEAYMKVDVEGTGIAQMHKFLLAGKEDKLLDYEPWGDAPFAVFEIDPEPHAFFGRSIADLIMNDQDSSTAMLRGVMDNVALTNNPRQGYVNGQVNLDDLMNNEIGGLVRMTSPNALVDITTPFVAGQVLVAMQYFDDAIEVKTGVTRASMGLDPNALQNTTATAANLTAQQGAGQIEVMARNLAEGGMKRLFKLMLNLLVENSCEETMMRLNGQYTPIDPRTWNTAMDVTVNVGLGTGREEQKQVALNQALQTQLMFWQTYGPQNGLVSLTGIRNTLGDILVNGGVKNVDRHFNPMSIEQEKQMMAQQAEQAQQPETSPEAEALVQAEQYKADKKSETDMLKLQIDAQKAISTDDRERDKMDQDLVIDAARILGKYDSSVDTARIKQAQQQPRYPQQTPVQAVTGGRF